MLTKSTANVLVTNDVGVHCSLDLRNIKDVQISTATYFKAHSNNKLPHFISFVERDILKYFIFVHTVQLKLIGPHAKLTPLTLFGPQHMDKYS